MPYTKDLLDELNLLTQFNLHTTQEGLKIHTNAAPEMIAAGQRLFSKELITQPDGGYLTSLGITAAEHTQNLLQIIKTA